MVKMAILMYFVSICCAIFVFWPQIVKHEKFHAVISKVLKPEMQVNLLNLTSANKAIDAFDDAHPVGQRPAQAPAPAPGVAPGTPAQVPPTDAALPPLPPPTPNTVIMPKETPPPPPPTPSTTSTDEEFDATKASLQDAVDQLNKANLNQKIQIKNLRKVEQGED
jgi:hypothetical protein